MSRVARQRYDKAIFEVGSEEGLDIVEDESKPQQGE